MMGQVYGQNLHFTSYGTKEGLIQNSVYSTIQTKEGFMWFGTQHGLNRFDGVKFKAMEYTKSNDTIGNSRMIVSMHIDKFENFWLGTSEEVILYDRFKNEIYDAAIKYPGLTFEGEWINQITTDGQNRLWMWGK
ncbi:MAG TPA: two-component regulator propeller domain-containing protein, partial [Saprospiraceae bacterium]|nr:two-component regulator propeller domain-containing protein [Saprospiraceae bacterium]